jgi:Calx-beta domain/Carboxypeptidase regulatory-like domain/Beta-propeller repeat
MITRIPPPTCTHRVVLILAIVCLLATFTGVILVGAHSDNNNSPPSAAADQVTADRTRIAEQFGKLPLSFEINKGQLDGPVKFLSHGAGYDLFLTANEAVLKVQKPPAQPGDKLKGTAAADADVREGTVLRLRMLGANATPQVEGQEELPGKIHYFIGNDPAKWRRNIPTYRKAYFKDVYPGIDVVYYGKQRELEYDFVVAAGANPKLIRFTVEGAEQIRLDKSGRLRLNLKHGEVSLNKPVIYQLNENGSRQEVKGAYVIKGNEVRFKLEQFDSSKPLIIDPVLLYSTLLGSGNNDQAFGISVDSQGSAYVTGSTDGTTFPTTAGAFKSTSTRSGAFVTKLDPAGSTLVYSTYISGEGTTTGTSIAVDSAGNAHITGNTSARDFPIVNGLKTTSNFFKTTDAAVTWNNQNTGLVGDVTAMAVAPNAPNTIYAATSDGIYRSTDAGATWTKVPATGLSSASFATALAVDPTNSLVVYVSVFSGLSKSTDGGNNWTTINTAPLFFSSVSTIVFDPVTPSTMYIGASNGVFKSTNSGASWIAQNNFSVPGTPNVRALAIDPTTPLTLYAGTSGNGLFKSTNGGGVWTAANTGMGGPNPTNVNVIAIDPANPATIYTGHGFSGGINKSTNGAASWTPLTNEVPQSQVNAMVATSSAVYASVSSGVIKSTNGGTNWTTANTGLWNPFVRTLVVHPTDPSVLYAGTSSTFSSDAFVTKLNSSGSGLLFSTLLGGGNEEIGNGIAVDGNGNIYVAGQTTSLNFPVANAVQSAPTTSDSCFNGFVTKLNPAVPSYVFSTYLRGSQCDTANSVAVDSSGNVYVTGTTGSTDFLIANAFQPTLAGPQFSGGDAFVTKLTGDGALTYSTYLGGSSSETGYGITADSSGNAYITGFTNSTNFPTMNPIQGSNGGGFNTDAFVTKLNSQGSALVFSTYLGGAGSESGRGIAIDSANNVYITGSSDSGDFPLVVGALRTKSPMYKSIDGAASWTNDNYGFSGATFSSFGGSSITALAINPAEPSTIYAGSSFGVFKSTNGGRTWSPMNNGLTSRNVTALVINPSAPSTLYVAVNNFGNGSGVYKSTDGGSTWNLRNNGLNQTDLLSLAIDPVTPNTLYVGVSFCCVVGTHIYKTTDGADSWAPIANAPPLVPSSIVIDPLNHSTIYVGDAASTTTVYKSPDAGTTWQNLVLPGSSSPVRSVAVSSLTAGLVYASNDQFLFRSVDGGTNWSQISSLTGKIVLDPVSASTVYLLTSPFAFNPQGLLKSTDNGQTWTPMNKGLDTLQALALAIDPQKPSTLYLASTTPSSSDAFVTKINPAGSALLYSTFLGGPPSTQCCFNTNSQAFGIALDSSGNAYVTGVTGSVGFPVTPESYQPFNRGSNDAFISKLGISYLISGRVLNNGASDSPLGGVEVVLSDGTSLTSVITESDGSYQFSRLREGGNYTVSASKPHFTMTPASQTFNNLSSDQVLNFSALTSDSPFYTISGQITENGAPLPNVTVTLSGSQSGLRTTDSNGNYSFDLIVAGNYTVTPSAVGFNFGPTSQTFNALSANQTANFTATRQNFVVTNTNNHGSGSLRDAIINANATPGTDTITFNIPGPGVKTINLVISLPDITDRVVIDGTTQPGYAGTPLIELNGSAAGGNANGLVIKAGGSTVRGLAIGNFGANFGSGNGIVLNACDNNVIQANYIGIAPDGTTARLNSRGIQLTSSSNNVIGGTTSATRNVISGNSTGIEISGSSNVIQGNFIGTNATGTAAVRNNNAIGIFSSEFTNNLIGGTAAGAGNLISGNGSAIVTNGNGTTIQGNLIGTDVTGTIKLPNTLGIEAVGLNMLIGGVTPGARNIISGNQGQAIGIRGTGSKVQGNYIGTDITGTLALGNGASGVVATDNVLIGGTEPGARNIISANSNSGNVVLGFNSFSPTFLPTTVQGNYIGTDVTGTRALGGSAAGISILSNNHIIGGLVEGARNVISGNAIGIQIGGSFSGTVGNIIQGNYIGLNAAGTGPLPNSQQGIAITDAVGNKIGGTQSGAANKIAFNGGPGLTISSTGTGNSIRGNSIFSNNGLGIDLGINGVTANDSNDSDTGPNQLQNFPVITSVTSTSNSTTIQGSLKSIPNTTFQIDFYSNATVDPSGNGEGAQFFGTTSVNTNGNGDANINVTFPIGLAAGRVITATATDPNGNTSEFSAADTTGAAGSLQFSISSIAVIEDVGTLPVTVLRTGGAAGSLTVDYTTANGTAIAGKDYTASSGTLTFAAGETSKTIQIPILDDATTEGDETFTISLSNTPTIESLGAPGTLLVTLQDRTTTPTLLINSLVVPEGNTGSTTEALFTINLSAATGRAVSVDFATVNLGAFGGAKCDNSAGIDYVSTSGKFSFPTGTTSFAVPITICGDTNAEANESFRVALSNVTGATVIDNQGFGTIVDDDLLGMLLEESGPTPSQAAAIEAVLALRDPFSLFMPDWYTPGVNENTRVALFAQNLQLNPGEQPSAVRVLLQSSSFQFFSISAEDVRPVRDSEFTQVVFRLPNNLTPGTCTVQIFAHSRTSNTGTFRVAP